MEKKSIYIVMKSIGQYEDRFESPVKAFTDKEKAEKYVKENNDYYSELEDKYCSIDCDVHSELGEMFLRYLQDSNKKLYDNYEQKMNEDEYDDVFWDAYYDEEDKFKDNINLIKKYFDICGLSEEKRDAILIFKEYEAKSEFHDGLPYFYVSRNALELED